MQLLHALFRELFHVEQFLASLQAPALSSKFVVIAFFPGTCHCLNLQPMVYAANLAGSQSHLGYFSSGAR
jgi:hypothetical protein